MVHVVTGRTAIILRNRSMQGDRLEFASAIEAATDEGNSMPFFELVTALLDQRSVPTLRTHN